MKAFQSNRLSEELRRIEQEIDNYYLQNPLTRMPFAVSAWIFIAFCEDLAFFHFVKSQKESMHIEAAFADGFVNHLKNPLLWLYSSCGRGGKAPRKYDESTYEAAKNLSELGEQYESFEYAFTYASRGLLNLEIYDSNIVPSPDFSDEAKYEAYDRLVKSTVISPNIEKVDKFDELARSVKVSGDHFTYKLTPEIIHRTVDFLSPLLKARYTLPDDWIFERYSLDDFRNVSIILQGLAYIHFFARSLAASRGCVGLGYADSILIANNDGLLRRLARFSGISKQTVKCLIDDLTYGLNSILKPDPAIQPLIKLNDSQYAIMPNLFIYSSMERNFSILLNRLPTEREVYLKLVTEKEILMRQKLVSDINIPNTRFFNGEVPFTQRVPDIDLAIINDIEKTCLFLELKWFIEPAEEREVIEKSEEIRKGISQLIRLKNAIGLSPQPFFDALKMDSSYDLCFAVASENFIGLHSVQHPEIPVLKKAHLIRKLSSLAGYRDLFFWLRNRSYLPVEEKHYEVVEKIWKVGDWGIKWYGIKPLITDEFE